MIWAEKLQYVRAHNPCYVFILTNQCVELTHVFKLDRVSRKFPILRWDRHDAIPNCLFYPHPTYLYHREGVKKSTTEMS